MLEIFFSYLDVLLKFYILILTLNSKFHDLILLLLFTNIIFNLPLQDRLWRKNRVNNYGVDINRNFGIAFGSKHLLLSVTILINAMAYNILALGVLRERS